MSKQTHQVTTVSAEIAGRTLSLETGKLAPQANAAVLARYGDTVVLATVVMGPEKPEMGYFPLSVEYVERLYAGGKIKGSRWVKREGKPSDEAILIGRAIDRSIRPLFPKGMINDVQVVVTELSVDGDNEPSVLGLIAASAALSISNIPWKGPIAASYVGKVNGEYVINPIAVQREESSLELLVSSTPDKVIMIEAGADELPEAEMMTAIESAHAHNQQVMKLINELVDKIQPVKVEFTPPSLDPELSAQVGKLVKQAVSQARQQDQAPDYAVIWETVKAEFAETDNKQLSQIFEQAYKKAIRELIVKGERPDGRKFDQIREIYSEVNILPRTHGSAIFSRGTTQVLTTVTLGTPSLEQFIETAAGEETKRYIHHYSMPPYSVGETGRIGPPKRREVGHGALAEKALVPVIPDEDSFPYTIRLVSEVMSSNGSTSQASVCGSTLALMDAGVPIRKPVAGVAMGLISDAPNGPIILSDIAGVEDFNGDMDFKVAGTDSGITAIQLDVKIDGLEPELIVQILKRAQQDRLFILQKMHQTLPKPRPEVSAYAPKVVVMHVPVEKIGEVIGPGGRMIRKIITDTGAAIDIDDDGKVTISAIDSEGVRKASEWIHGLVSDPEIGKIYQGVVTKILPFGAFVEIMPGKEGLVHVSRMSHDYVEDPHKVVQVGQPVEVKVTEIDEMNRINLSMLTDEQPSDAHQDRYNQSNQRRPRSATQGRTERRASRRRR